ncbi:Crp/Fnr family transcriptional regulator [Marinovum sp.]|uniref:Crp/Fnr family transcriptional regulator n=1 Tax=Marinovum sp. TaxID=2024839 RepID=UPI003A8E562F
MSDWLSLFASAPIRRLDAGAVLFRREDLVAAMHLVRRGAVALERPLTDGTALTLHVASAGEGLAEASLFAERYHCDAVAREAAELAVLPRAAVLDGLRARPEAALSLIRTQAREVQAQRARVELLRLRRVADRLEAWLDLNGGPPAGGWVRVAEEIGVSPPALYRELARRRKAAGPH